MKNEVWFESNYMTRWRFGGWRVVGEQLHPTIRHAFEDKLFILDRIIEYDPIDPIEWFTEYHKFLGVWNNGNLGITLYLESLYRCPNTGLFFGYL